MTNNQINIELLREELHFLHQSIDTLMLSVQKCSALVGKNEYTFEEMESFDSLTSKFGRTSDLYTQKVLRTIWILLREPFIPFIDMLNIAEKLKIVHSTDQLLNIRDLRNQITHEYIPKAITELVPDVIEFSSILKTNIETTVQFINSRNWF